MKEFLAFKNICEGSKTKQKILKKKREKKNFTQVLSLWAVLDLVLIQF